MVNSSIGKYSEHGKPPPREIMPGIFRYFAAPFKLEGFLALLSRLRKSRTLSPVINLGRTDELTVPSFGFWLSGSLWKVSNQLLFCEEDEN